MTSSASEVGPVGQPVEAQAGWRALASLPALLHTHRHLLWEITKRDLADRYRGHALGLLWSVGHPLFLIGMYLFVFAVVFKAAMGGTLDYPRDYPTYLLAGLIPWMGFLESMAAGCVAITSNRNLVKQVIFPIEILPIKAALTSLANQLIMTAVLLLYVFIRYRQLWPTAALVPFLLVVQCVAMIGVNYFLASVTVFLKDVTELVRVFNMAGLYLVPVVYLPQWVPDLVRPILYVNPFSHLIWCYQDLLYFGRLEHGWSWLVVSVLALVTLATGFWFFQRCKGMFANFV